MATVSEALAIAIQHHQKGELQAAAEIYRQIIEADPNHPEATHLLGIVAYQVGKHYEAIALYRRAVQLKPDYSEAHNNLGNALKEQGKLDDAVACWRRALELKPDYLMAHNNLGAAYKDQGRFDEAVACYRRAIKLSPDYAEVYNNLGVVYKEQGKLDEAVACCRRAVELKPDYAEAHSNLAVVFTALGKLDDAVAYCCRALQLRPDFAIAHNNLGNAFKEQEKLDDAAACYRRALELKPDYAEAHNNLGNVFKDQGRLDDAIACYTRALEHDPGYVVAHSNLLFALQYRTGATPAALAAAHAEYDRRHAAQLRGHFKPSEERPARSGRLRVGFVSPDLGRHPVSYFLVRLLENFDRERIKTVCYSDRVVKDDMTHRIQAAATDWREGIGVSDEQLAEQIRADRIDVLFDLAGHTAHNRLLVFARKPAPIQVTWAGYVGTTGLKTMDYLLADRYEIPPEAEEHYQERALRMPDGYVCYDPPDYAPAVVPLPALDRGHVTFGCFNNPAKITREAIGVWAAILHRLPRARLVFRFRGWNDRSVAGRIAENFAARGIDANRLEFLGYSPHRELLAEYNRIDLALDPFPYSGGLTTCEALWMGVQVITFPGETFASRHSFSHLSNVGLLETIAKDLDDYAERAVSLAADLPRLKRMRAGLREQMAASPLCDGKRFADNLTRLLQGLPNAWR